VPTLGRKKKNNIDDWDEENLFQLDNFFTVEPPAASITSNNTNGQAANVHGTQATQPTTIRIKSSQMPGVSIKKIIHGDNLPKEESHGAQIQVKGENPFTQNDLLRCWNEFINTIPDKKILVTTMQSYKPTLKENFFIEVSVDNPMQEKDLLNERPTILAFLSQKLQNGKIQMYTRIMEETENKKMLSPKDRLKSMMEQNQNLADLYNQLELEID